MPEELKMPDSTADQREKLVADLRAVVADAEAVLASSAEQSGERLAAVRERVAERLGHAREQFQYVHEAASDRVRAARYATDDYVHANPWRAIGIAATLGLLMGVLVSRR